MQVDQSMYASAIDSVEKIRLAEAQDDVEKPKHSEETKKEQVIGS